MRASYAKARVEVFRHIDGNYSVRYKNELLVHERYEGPAPEFRKNATG
jgi:hypothetical protein